MINVTNTNQDLPPIAEQTFDDQTDIISHNDISLEASSFSGSVFTDNIKSHPKLKNINLNSLQINHNLKPSLTRQEFQKYGDRTPMGYNKIELAGKGTTAVVWIAFSFIC